MKTLTGPLLAHYASTGTTLATLWRVTRRDLQVFGFTNHDRPITYGAVTYTPSSVFDASAVATKADLAVDNLETTGLLDDAGITAADLEAGLWDGAEVWIAEINHRDTSMGVNILRYGTLGEIQRSGLMYTAELRGLMQRLQNNIGRIVTPACDAVLGDARCGVNLPALSHSGSVASVTSARLFTATVSGGTPADNTYTYGVLTWVTGANAGRAMEVKSQIGNSITLQLAMADPVLTADTFTMTPGCDKTKATCKLTFSNVVNFRGFSFVPGTDQTLKVGGQ